MATYYPSITDDQAALIRTAPLFFVASADPALSAGPDGIGPVNLSPKGGVPLHVIDPNRVAFLDYLGSGNETARHAKDGGPITVMVCSFAGADAGIVRLYGKATVTPLEESPHAALLLQAEAEHLRTKRQVIEVEVEQTGTSCGYGVPVMELVRERRAKDRGRRYKERKSRRLSA